MESGRKEVERVSEWTESSKERDEYISKNGQTRIKNMGNLI